MDIAQTGDPINVTADSGLRKLVEKVRSVSTELHNICKVVNGVKPFETGKGTPPQTAEVVEQQPYVAEGRKPDETWSPLLRGSLMQRYINLWDQNYWIKYGRWLAAPREPEIFFSYENKLFIRQTGDSLIATLIEKGFVARNNLHIILPQAEFYRLEYILGIINSKTMDTVYSLMNPEKGEALAEVKKTHVEKLPIRTIDFDDPADKDRHDRLVALVDTMLRLKREHAAESAAFSDKRHDLAERIARTDAAIDALVYELYGLTDEEIALVEGSGG